MNRLALLLLLTSACQVRFAEHRIETTLSPTGEWHSGQVVVDRRFFTIDPETPAGEYAVVVGLYRPEDGIRLDVLDDEGQPVANYAQLTTISIP